MRKLRIADSGLTHGLKRVLSAQRCPPPPPLCPPADAPEAARPPKPPLEKPLPAILAELAPGVLKPRGDPASEIPPEFRDGKRLESGAARGVDGLAIPSRGRPIDPVPRA